MKNIKSYFSYHHTRHEILEKEDFWARRECLRYIHKSRYNYKKLSEIVEEIFGVKIKHDKVILNLVIILNYQKIKKNDKLTIESKITFFDETINELIDSNLSNKIHTLANFFVNEVDKKNFTHEQKEICFYMFLYVFFYSDYIFNKIYKNSIFFKKENGGQGFYLLNCSNTKYIELLQNFEPPKFNNYVKTINGLFEYFI
ncbi:hypothetical protein ASO20_00040 [Mycoplasma sp. (ex Biomphalaria glabrata)]|uniref:hypothetical protein n=1 Tax=Mycoplasma sp. (ex Biomphalaria glabrata) TaxID=1749074 RepID=UPI00073A64AD|nr:hypothetical protein [Mycoplasma sp. (ex Biomphalaria glabrata)]ALV23071.1 hypothetical protein ASO20_00040 [Mycoplasma sp. (ex Biomphalaria glabrata)]